MSRNSGITINHLEGEKLPGKRGCSVSRSSERARSEERGILASSPEGG